MMNLDEVMDCSISGASGSVPLFVQDCGKKVTDGAEAYARKVIQITKVKPINDAQTALFIDNEIGALLDCIDDSNRVYFKNGMKLGASLILQLLGAWEEQAAVRN